MRRIEQAIRKSIRGLFLTGSSIHPHLVASTSYVLSRLKALAESVPMNSASTRLKRFNPVVATWEARTDFPRR